MSVFVCSTCGTKGMVVSVEVVHEAFPCFPDGKGGVAYEHRSEQWGVERKHFMCKWCSTTFTEIELLALDTAEE